MLPSAVEMAYWRKKGPAGKLLNWTTSITRSTQRLQNWKRCCDIVVPRGNKTRWGSFDNMIAVFLTPKVQAAFDKWRNRYAESSGIDDEDILCADDIEQLKKIHSCLQALRDAGKFLEGSEATIERVIPTFEYLLEHLEKAKVCGRFISLHSSRFPTLFLASIPAAIPTSIPTMFPALFTPIRFLRTTPSNWLHSPHFSTSIANHHSI